MLSKGGISRSLVFYSLFGFFFLEVIVVGAKEKWELIGSEIQSARSQVS